MVHESLTLTLTLELGARAFTAPRFHVPPAAYLLITSAVSREAQAQLGLIVPSNLAACDLLALPVAFRFAFFFFPFASHIFAPRTTRVIAL